MLVDVAKNWEAFWRNVASIQDRVLKGNGKKQIYGSQLFINEKTGKYEFFPIKDEENVNNKRHELGLQPLEVYLKSWDIKYVLIKSAGK
ncbi:MAG: hypothetical protein KAW92_05725 [Candidatus Cloacimonetes bacterium]|nr:hypothetical protein [Candidatus Cloacimonadota bacterium]